MTDDAGVAFPTLSEIVGDTPVVRLQRLAPEGTTVLAKLEGNNPAGSVKDRPAFSMIAAAERDGRIVPGDLIVEATSGNTGIALAAAAAVLGYRFVLVIPEGSSRERLDTMRAYGAEVVETPREQGMEHARDVAEQIERERGAVRLDQFSNPANPASHVDATAREIWEQTHGRVTHVVCTMGTTGTVTGVSRGMAALAPHVKVYGVQPAPGASIPGIRAWPQEYLPAIFDDTYLAGVREVSGERAIETARELARQEGLLLGLSAGGAAAVALELASENPGSVVLFVAPDRGDRYLSTGVFG
ncbi:pyridoxal-phosphate dependent enzyme [Demequina zhanjiangensis]|uniref:Pyridoxal-phosphate dependent enzyme n=1 Tax=Demequina zhanjiangensis TaxID=3051659 RepID=A0ABT8G302_9MICO|nr:pyridoxal-phosphate dependent enzyme [Demequina sp. SYSU T00b26]MDN4473510.1 pyridoxal-phosphate dependent enzyme [Demequina sp. SYSU T00b26]